MNITKVKEMTDILNLHFRNHLRDFFLYELMSSDVERYWKRDNSYEMALWRLFNWSDVFHQHYSLLSPWGNAAYGDDMYKNWIFFSRKQCIYDSDSLSR